MVFWMLNWVGMLSVCVLLDHHINISLTHTCSGLALESLVTILTARYIPFFMILLIIGTEFSILSSFMSLLVFRLILIILFQQTFPCAFTQSPCYLVYITTAMVRLFITSRSRYERSYSEQRILVSGNILSLDGTDVYWCSGKKFWRSHYMGHYLLCNAHAIPVAYKKKRCRCRGETG